MRYYIPVREKHVKEAKTAPSVSVPLWVWIALLAFVLLLVMALR